MRHLYPRTRIVSELLTDVMLVAVLLAITFTLSPGPLSLALSVGIPCVLAWGLVTLHYPRAIEVDDDAIAFTGYGRTHRYPWSTIETIRVRRFLVRDRVLVRIVPAPPWRGRYWILDSIGGYPALLAGLERRAVPR